MGLFDQRFVWRFIDFLTWGIRAISTVYLQPIIDGLFVCLFQPKPLKTLKEERPSLIYSVTGHFGDIVCPRTVISPSYKFTLLTPVKLLPYEFLTTVPILFYYTILFGSRVIMRSDRFHIYVVVEFRFPYYSFFTKGHRFISTLRSETLFFTWVSVEHWTREKRGRKTRRHSRNRYLLLFTLVSPLTTMAGLSGWQVPCFLPPLPTFYLDVPV